ncbi:MAG: helix-turn-helix domain-containing protein, partial [Candidatus Marinamargulisbacteria bacterium]
RFSLFAILLVQSLGSSSDIGKKLREAREKQGLSRNELVKKADITVNTLYKIETGKMPKPSFEIVKKLSLALGIFLAEI